MKRRTRARFAGYGEYGPTKSYTFLVGRRPGLDGPWAPGSVIPMDQVLGTLIARRAAQVGAAGVGWTTTKVMGYYNQGGEPTAKITIYDTGLDIEKGKFDYHMRELAQQLATDLAQREIITIRHNGRRTQSDTASPVGAPPPTSNAFCSWVRQHSTVARRNPRDACYKG